MMKPSERLSTTSKNMSPEKVSPASASQRILRIKKRMAGIGSARPIPEKGRQREASSGLPHRLGDHSYGMGQGFQPAEKKLDDILSDLENAISASNGARNILGMIQIYRSLKKQSTELYHNQQRFVDDIAANQRLLSSLL